MNDDIEPMYPLEDGVIWPPRNLQDVKNNCKVWQELGYYEAINKGSSSTSKSAPMTEESIMRSNNMRKFMEDTK